MVGMGLVASEGGSWDVGGGVMGCMAFFSRQSSKVAQCPAEGLRVNMQLKHWGL
jgi:hypothetical protein